MAATVTKSPSPLLSILSSHELILTRPLPLASCAVSRPVSIHRLLPSRLGGISMRRFVRRSWRAIAASATTSSEQMVPSNDAVGPTIISTLLVAAFIGLSLLTIGVIYLAVQDFLQKREKDKFEKEEAAKKKKGGKKTKVKARAGPRGFGQKIEEEEDE